MARLKLVISNPETQIMEKKRCSWPKGELYVRYHDEEWGIPLHDERLLFEFLVLEGAQAGLSWSTILSKRENYRKAFDKFDPRKVARYDQTKVDELLSNSGIVRNKLKVNAAIQNAGAFLEVQKEFGTFDKYIWTFADKTPTDVRHRKMHVIPSRTIQSDAMSKDLLSRGFKFVGSTICYAFMQATGMVNDHIPECFRYAEIESEKSGNG